MKTIILIIGILFTMNDFVQASSNLPSFLDVCKRSNPNINECIWNSIEKLRPKLIAGIPSLYIPPMEPLLVSTIKVDQSAGPIYVKSNYKNVEIMGTSKFQIKDVQMNFSNNSFLLKLFFPALNVTSDYSITGKILIMPIDGKGILKANFTDIVVTCILSGERYKNKMNDGREDEYFKVTEIDISFTIEGSKTHLNNLFNGEPTLGKTMNKFLNDNWRIIALELKPIMEAAIAEMLKEMTDDFFNVFSYDQLFPK